MVDHRDPRWERELMRVALSDLLLAGILVVAIVIAVELS